MKIRFTIQTIFLVLFLYLLWQATFPLEQLKSFTDLFLRLDPLVVSLMPILTKSWLPSLFIGIGILCLAIIFGRLFCGYICPMGTSLDLANKLVTNKNKTEVQFNVYFIKSKHFKYIFLALLTTAAFFGVNQIFWGSPIALITRFYSLLIHPLLLLISNKSLAFLRPIAESQELKLFEYTQIDLRVFHSVYFVGIFFLLLFLLERFRPRFWCRYICPAGAILGVLSWRPIWRRRVHKCVQCQSCVKSCPTGAILEDGKTALHAECITCQTCVKVCPVQGVSFSFTNINQDNNLLSIKSKILPSRRTFLYAAVTGGALAGLAHLNASSFVPSLAKATLNQLGCIRPPGALPETDFLARCLRCGLCMKACPTNGLQPAGLITGFEGVFSPLLISRLGPCEPECNICGQVCPTQAILDLPLADKRQAKIGTAVVYPQLCLAWAEKRSCVVCQEVCAYGAVELKSHATSSVPVPTINQNKCYGCGFCEHHCPVRIPAIAVQPLNVLRLKQNNYAEAAKGAGLDLIPVSLRPYVNTHTQKIPKGQLPPGFTQ